MSADKSSTIKVLLVIVTLELGIIIGLVTGLLLRASGTDIAGTFRGGGVGFAGTVTLTIMIMSALGLFARGGTPPATYRVGTDPVSGTSETAGTAGTP